jgi:WD40 repeat protein
VVRAWSGTDGAYLRTLSGTHLSDSSKKNLRVHRLHTLAVDGSNGTVYGGGISGAIRVWSGTDGSRLVDLEGHPDHDVRALAVAVDGTLYSGSSDRTIRVWSNGLRVRTLIGHSDRVTTLAIGTQDKLYSGSRDNTVRVWSAADGTHLSTLEGHTDSVESVAVGLDGTVYSGSWDNTVRVWAGDGGRPLRTLQGHTNSVLAVAVGSDGTIYSLSLDKTIRVWSGATCAVRVDVAGSFRTLVLGRGDKLYSIGGMNGSSVWW